jgi:tetratricopeptide (TPR) repeat protein
VYERKGADLKALKHYRESIRRKGDYLPALSAAAKLLIRYGKKDEAVLQMRTASERYSTNVDILVLYANVLTMALKYEDSIRVAKKALRIDERHAGAMLQIGKANLKMGRLELAESIFNQVLAINENIAEVHFLIGLLELKKGFRILAIKKFEKAVALNPFYPEALNNLALEYMLAGNYQDAIKLFRRAIQITPSWGVLYLNYGNALRGAGNWKLALASLTRAGKMMPNSPAVVFNLAVLYYTADNLNGLPRMARLKKSRSLFSDYKTRKGASLSQDDDVYKYIKELDLMIEREQIRVQRQKEAAEREKQRATHKSEPAQKPDAGGADEGDGGWESAGDDGWE